MLVVQRRACDEACEKNIPFLRDSNGAAILSNIEERGKGWSTGRSMDYKKELFFADTGIRKMRAGIAGVRTVLPRSISQSVNQSVSQSVN